jgi:hypothetical protein
VPLFLGRGTRVDRRPRRAGWLRKAERLVSYSCTSASRRSALSYPNAHATALSWLYEASAFYCVRRLAPLLQPVEISQSQTTRPRHAPQTSPASRRWSMDRKLLGSWAYMISLGGLIRSVKKHKGRGKATPIKPRRLMRPFHPSLLVDFKYFSLSLLFAILKLFFTLAALSHPEITPRSRMEAIKATFLAAQMATTTIAQGLNPTPYLDLLCLDRISTLVDIHFDFRKRLLLSSRSVDKDPIPMKTSSPRVVRSENQSQQP